RDEAQGAAAAGEGRMSRRRSLAGGALGGALAVALGGAACAPTDRYCPIAEGTWPDRLARTRADAEHWLRLREVTAARFYDAPNAPPPQVRPPAPGRGLALLSYPDVAADHPLAGRSYLYDDA